MSNKPRLYLPLHAIHTDEDIERQAIILRLKTLSVLVAGWDSPKEDKDAYIETVYLKDILEKEEHLERARLMTPRAIPRKADPEAAKEVLRWLRKNKKHKEEGTREFY